MNILHARFSNNRMGMNDKELSHIRMLANGVVARSNASHKWAAAVEVRRLEKGASISLAMRPGTEKPREPMLELGDLADEIRNELRLERTSLGAAVYGTSETTFESDGNPVFHFNTWRLDEV